METGDNGMNGKVAVGNAVEAHTDAQGAATNPSHSLGVGIAEVMILKKQDATNRSVQLTAIGVSGRSTPPVHGPVAWAETAELENVTVLDPGMED